VVGDSAVATPDTTPVELDIERPAGRAGNTLHEVTVPPVELGASNMAD
jgi:hypothetical protein